MSKLPTKCCGTCRWWDATSARDKAGRVRKYWGGACTVVIVWPTCYSGANEVHRLPMMKSDGADCPLWEPWPRVH